MGVSKILATSTATLPWPITAALSVSKFTSSWNKKKLKKNHQQEGDSVILKIILSIK